MTDRTIVAEFGSSKINLGLPGEGIPLKNWNCLGPNSGFLVSSTSSSSSSSSSHQPTTTSTSSNITFSLRSSSNSNTNNDIQLFDVESCGIWSSSVYSSNYVGDQSFHLKRNVFGDPEHNGRIPDVEIASHVFNKLIQNTNFLESTNSVADRNLLFIPPDAVFLNNDALQSWCDMIFEYHNQSSNTNNNNHNPIKNLFPLRAASGATIDSGRLSAVVLDAGHSSARVSLVYDGVIRLTNTVFHSASFNCSGKNLTMLLEQDLIQEISNRRRQQEVSEDGEEICGTNENNNTSPSFKFFDSYFPSASTFSSAFQTASRYNVLREIKHSCGCVRIYQNNDMEEEEQGGVGSQQQNSKTKPAIYVAPDGNQVLLSGATRSSCYEQLFTFHGHMPAECYHHKNTAPSIRDYVNNTSIVDLVVDVYNALPPDHRLSLPLLCIGGTCRTEGFSDRLAASLRQADSLFQRTHPMFPQDDYCAWRGASFLCSAPALEDKGSWISKEKLEEYGVERLRKGLFG